MLVTLNRDEAIDPEQGSGPHGVRPPGAGPGGRAGQGVTTHEINGTRRTWFVGAYWGYGFHEDGVRSAVDTCRAMGVAW